MKVPKNPLAAYKDGVSYEAEGHKWHNVTLECGCRQAVCEDATPARENTREMAQHNTALFNLRQALGVVAKPELMEKAVELIKKEQDGLTGLITRIREENKFTEKVDFNGENFFLFVSRNPACVRRQN
jgi:hypothetical protein